MTDPNPTVRPDPSAPAGPPPRLYEFWAIRHDDGTIEHTLALSELFERFALLPDDSKQKRVASFPAASFEEAREIVRHVYGWPL